MRAFLIGLMTASAALSLAACDKKEDANPAAPATQATADGQQMIPNPKPGLWQQTIAMDGSAAPMNIQVCLDEATGAQLSAYGDRTSKEMCPENTTTRQPDGTWVLQSTCNMGTGGIVKSTGKATGDFNSDYRIETTSTTTGAAVPQMNRTMTMNMSAKWMGACPKDMIPGDVKMPTGQIVNIGKTKAMAGAAK